jgi:O-6-methylguanine DNA methyltransferase
MACFGWKAGAPGRRFASMKSTGPGFTTTLIDSPLGTLLAGAAAHGLCLLEFLGGRRVEQETQAVARIFGPAVEGHSPHLERLRAELAEYFAGRRRAFTVPLLTPGTPFEERVWGELRRIPYGETLSYGAMARRLGIENGQRAVGTANGRNRIAIVVPCHRVINEGGGLGGYGGGLWRKSALLALERTGQAVLPTAG